MTQRELVDELGSEKSNMVRVVDDLEGAGLVERRPVPTDRRAHAVVMTAKGGRSSMPLTIPRTTSPRNSSRTCGRVKPIS